MDGIYSSNRSQGLLPALRHIGCQAKALMRAMSGRQPGSSLLLELKHSNTQAAASVVATVDITAT